jgi:cell division protein FtsB
LIDEGQEENMMNSEQRQTKKPVKRVKSPRLQIQSLLDAAAVLDSEPTTPDLSHRLNFLKARLKVLTTLAAREQNVRMKRLTGEVTSLKAENIALKTEIERLKDAVAKREVEREPVSSTLDARLAEVERDFYGLSSEGHQKGGCDART